jgi:hypothetical protein
LQHFSHFHHALKTAVKMKLAVVAALFATASAFSFVPKEAVKV